MFGKYFFSVLKWLLLDSISWLVRYCISGNLLIFMCIIGVMLCRLVFFVRLKYELFFRNLVENVVNGLNRMIFLLLMMCVLRCGIDIGGELIDVLL